MTKITCDICMDLMPLVRDGVASEDSVTAVMNHISDCEDCKKIYDEMYINNKSITENNNTPQQIKSQQLNSQSINIDKAAKKVEKKINKYLGMIIMFGIFFGLSLTASEEMFLNSFIMPIIGVFGYYLFRWKAAYTVPCIIVISNFIINGIGFLRGVEPLDIMSVVMWGSVYSLFAIIGTIIAGLLHFGLRKE